MIRNLVPLCSIISDSTRCELLSKVDIFDIRNNPASRAAALHAVVNGSQKVDIFDIRNNTLLSKSLGDVGCELLSKVDIFDIRNNLENH